MEAPFTDYRKTIIASTAANTSLYMANGISLMREISFRKNRMEINANTKADTNPTM